MIDHNQWETDTTLSIKNEQLVKTLTAKHQLVTAKHQLVTISDEHQVTVLTSKSLYWQPKKEQRVNTVTEIHYIEYHK